MSNTAIQQTARNFKNNTNSDTIERLPPQALDMEEGVLGSIMQDKDALANVIDIISPECFYVEAHQVIFSAMRDLYNKSKPVDLLTVFRHLSDSGKIDFIGGAAYLSQLTMRVGSTANIEYYARIVSEKYIARELIRTSNENIKAAFDTSNDVFDLIDSAEKGLFGITEKNLRRSYDTMATLTAAAMRQLEHISKQDGGLVGVPSGFSGLDRLTAGWQKSDLIILAARPAMGKTAFMLNLTLNAAKNKKAVGIFSLEMSSLQLVNRLITAETGISSEKLRRADLNKNEWLTLTQKMDIIANMPIFMDDTPAINIFELRAKCRRLKMQHNVELIIIDYLQLMSGDAKTQKSGGNREQEISTISRSLKAIAKELDIPIIALSQLSREVEKRGGDKRPQLSDLRESGAIEQDADMVMFLYRPEYYGITQDEEGAPTTGITEVIVSKHRNGALATVKTYFRKDRMQFTDEQSTYADYTDNDDNTISISAYGKDRKQIQVNMADDDDSLPY